MRARTKLLKAQPTINELEETVDFCFAPELEEAWQCVKQAALNDSRWECRISGIVYTNAHEAAVTQAQEVLGIADSTRMHFPDGVPDRDHLQEMFEIVGAAAKQFSELQIVDLQSLIEREFHLARRVAESAFGKTGAESAEKKKRISPVPIPKNPRVVMLAETLKKQMEKPREQWGSQNEVAKSFVTNGGLLPFTPERESEYNSLLKQCRGKFRDLWDPTRQWGN